MQRIIYSSPAKIEWDAQSAFKLTNYYTDDENCMVFCYLKQYVQNGDLKLCTFCFDSEAAGKEDLQLCFNLNPEKTDKYINISFGIDGIGNVAQAVAQDTSVSNRIPDENSIAYSSFKSNDQQGYYWCGEITVKKEYIKDVFDAELKEGSIIVLNLYKTFTGKSDYACLFPDSENDILRRNEYMQEFVVLDY